jgi:hypothetical protein
MCNIYWLDALRESAILVSGGFVLVCFDVLTQSAVQALCRLLHRQLGRLGSLEDFVHVVCNPPVAVRPPASTNSLLTYVDGNRFFDAKSAIRFTLANISGPPGGR